jgi:two-component system, LuxR family, sensor kinase FixL
MATDEDERQSSQAKNAVSSVADAVRSPLSVPPAGDEVNLLVEIYPALISERNLATGLQNALKIIGEYAGWCLISIWLPTDDDLQIRPFVSWHEGNPALAEFIENYRHQSLNRDVGIPGRVWSSATLEWVTDLEQKSPERFPLMGLARKAGLKATLGAPIIYQDRVIGVLMCGAYKATSEYHNLARKVSYVATQLGVALHQKQIEEQLRKQEELIHRSRDELELRISERTVQLKVANEALRSEIFARKRLHEELQRRVRQQETVAYLGQRTWGQESLPLLLQEVAERVSQTMDVEFCKILELQPDGEALVLRAGVGWRDGLVGTAKVSSGHQSQAGYTLASGGPVVVNDLRTETRFQGPALLLEHGVVSGISVEIGGSSRAFGVLGVHTARSQNFSNEDVKFLESVAHVLSQSIARESSGAAIRKSESWLRNLIATTQDAVVSIDRRGCVVLFNRSAERIFGYAAHEIIGRKVNELMAEPYSSEHDGYIERYERTGEARAIGRIRTVRGKRKDGEEFPLELSVTEIEVDNEIHYAAFIRDISANVALHNRAVENERLAAIGGTAARIGHEIANPLNGIYLTLQLVEQRLARQTLTDERVAADMLKAKKEVGRLNQLVQEFRNLSRKQEYKFRSTDLPAIIDEVLDPQRPVCESSGIVIKRRDAGDLPAVDIDEDKFKQALLNLIKNAIEAMPQGGELAVSTACSSGGNDLIIIVSDTGTGVAPGTDIFAPFLTTKRDGSGLGLIIVRQIVSAHGGTLSCDSRPGVGTEFRIILPRARGQET